MLVVKCDMKHGEMEDMLCRSTEMKLSEIRSGLTAEDDDGKGWQMLTEFMISEGCETEEYFWDVEENDLVKAHDVVVNLLVAHSDHGL